MTGTGGEISGTKPRRMNGKQTERVPRDPFDWYVEESFCVDLLLDREPFAGRCWDPCAGCGTIPKRVEVRGIICLATDIVDRGYHEGLIGGIDFTAGYKPLWPIDNIIMNPPYRQGEAFVRQALKVARRKVAALVQAKFLYSQRRWSLFNEKPPSAVYHLSKRPSMPPGELLMANKIKAKGGKMDFSWVVWSREYVGSTQTHWVKP